jgi:hypothetical protein
METYYQKNKESLLPKIRAYQLKNKDRIRERLKGQLEEKRPKVSAYNASYYRQNKSKILLQKKKYIKNRKLNDVNFRIAAQIRTRLSMAVSRKQKASSSIEELGCSVEEFKKYIEAKFLPGMSWDNWSKNGWHLDHIKPLASFDLTNIKDFKLACHHTNYQPLWAVDNLRKGDRYMLK